MPKQIMDFYPFYLMGEAADLYVFFSSEYTNDFESQIK